jgi:hypothetical protein
VSRLSFPKGCAFVATKHVQLTFPHEHDLL